MRRTVTTVQGGLEIAEIALMLLVCAAVLLALSRGLKAAERRGWVRLHGAGKGSAAVAFAAMEDMFSASRSQARQLLEEQKRVGDRAPTPGDGLDEAFDLGPGVTGGYAGKVTLRMHGSLHHATARTAESPVDPTPERRHT